MSQLYSRCLDYISIHNRQNHLQNLSYFSSVRWRLTPKMSSRDIWLLLRTHFPFGFWKMKPLTPKKWMPHDRWLWVELIFWHGGPESSLQTSSGVTVPQAHGLRRKWNPPFLILSLGSRLLWIRAAVITKNWVLVSLCRGCFAVSACQPKKGDQGGERALKDVLWEVSDTCLA